MPLPAFLGPIIGGGLGLLGSLLGPDEQTTTQQNYPSPFLTGAGGPGYGNHNLLANINNLLGSTLPGARQAVPRGDVAASQLFSRGQLGNPLERKGQNFIKNILSGGAQPTNTGITGNTLGTASSIIGGQGLSPDTNPFLQQTFNRAADLTRGRLASEFAGQGRDLAASRPARSEELQTLASNIFGGNYQAERNRQAGLTGQSLGLGQAQNQLGVQQQMGALGSALPFANQDYTNIQAMIQAGNDPINSLINRISAIAPAAGGTATMSQPVYNDPIGSALGGAALGSQFGGLFGGLFGNKPTGGGNPYGSFY